MPRTHPAAFLSTTAYQAFLLCTCSTWGDSGSVRNPDERHFILAGVAVFERQIYHLISQADEFVSSLDLGDTHDVELHGSVIASGRKAPWKGVRRRDVEIALTSSSAGWICFVLLIRLG